MHEGLDFAAPRGTPIYASAAGIVVAAKYVNGYGKLVEIEHGNSILTRYAHSARLYVKQGDLVERGQLIAEVGSSGRSTGSHLHFEVRMAGQPLDPRLFLGDQAPAGSTIVRADHEAGLSP
jgi:murein DD-endopeptidase MepM/ murein hydrolase activator NlpD